MCRLKREPRFPVLVYTHLYFTYLHRVSVCRQTRNCPNNTSRERERERERNCNVNKLLLTTREKTQLFWALKIEWLRDPLSFMEEARKKACFEELLLWNWRVSLPLSFPLTKIAPFAMFNVSVCGGSKSNRKRVYACHRTTRHVCKQCKF